MPIDLFRWQRSGREWLTATPRKEDADGSCGTSTSVAMKGYCVVYSDLRRFEVPLAYLGTAVFIELLHMSREEFGFAGDDGRITLLCDAAVMKYVMCLLRGDASEELVRAFLSSISMVRPCHHSVSGMVPSMRQSAICV